MRKRCGTGGAVFVALGLGLFLAYCLPGNVLVIALAVILVGAGIILLKA